MVELCIREALRLSKGVQQTEEEELEADDLEGFNREWMV